MGRFFIVVVILLCFCSCELINPPEQIPSYIRIDSISLSVSDPDSLGTASHKITDAWVTINEKDLGMYELPATFPVLDAGTASIMVSPGIKMNGIAATRIVYPFYNSFFSTVTLKPAEIISVSPVVEYNQRGNIQWLEDFEIGIGFEKFQGSDTIMIRTTNPSEVFEGSAAGKIDLNKARPRAHLRTVFPLPQKFAGGGNPVFVEINYKSTVPLYVNLGAQYTLRIDEIPILRINPSGIWNKIYINLTPSASETYQAEEHFLILSTTLPSEQTEGQVLLDNVKLIY